jgi:hypothetical protein
MGALRNEFGGPKWRRRLEKPVRSWEDTINIYLKLIAHEEVV